MCNRYPVPTASTTIAPDYFGEIRIFFGFSSLFFCRSFLRLQMFCMLLFAAGTVVVVVIFYLFITTVPCACGRVCAVASSFHSVNEIKLSVTLVFIFFYRCFYSISLLFWFYDRIPTDNHNNCVIQFSILSLSLCVHLSFCLSPFSHLL